MTTSIPNHAEIVTIGVIRLESAYGLELPSYETAGSVGFDLQAAIEQNDELIIAPADRVLVPTGLIFELPNGYEVQIRPRSGLALKSGITVLNSPGTIDSDYRGEIKIILINHGTTPFVVHRGMRIAQAVVAPIVKARIEPRQVATKTERGSGGFGSTGI